jgi:hypothetical protein
VFPPPPARVCPPSAVSSFSACVPGGQSVGRTNFRPVCSLPADLGPFRTQPAHPSGCSTLLRSESGTEIEETPAAGAKPPGLSSQAAPRGALGRTPACSWGIRAAGRIRARESSSPDSAANKKRQVLLPPPPPRCTLEETVFCRNATSSSGGSRSALRRLTRLGEACLRGPGPATGQRVEEGLDCTAKSERGHLVTLARPRGMQRRHRTGWPRGRSGLSTQGGRRWRLSAPCASCSCCAAALRSRRGQSPCAQIAATASTPSTFCAPTGGSALCPRPALCLAPKTCSPTV